MVDGPKTVDLHFNDVPFHLFCKFKDRVNRDYNNCHWAKLQDLITKAEAYDAFIAYGIIFSSENEETDKDNDGDEMITIGGLRKDGTIRR